MKLMMTQTDGEIEYTYWLEELAMLKWPFSPKQSTDSVPSLWNTNAIFCRTRTNNFKICMETKTQTAKTNLKKNKVRDIMLPHLKLDYKAIKIVWYWHKTNIHVNGIE